MSPNYHKTTYYATTLVLTPSRTGFMSRTKEKLVCCLDGRVYVLEQAREGLVAAT
jgi:hypothetical protein